MTAIADNPALASLTRLVRAPATWMAAADVAAILLALSLPWSTTLVAVFAVLMLIAMVPFLNVEALLRSLQRPIAAVPIALFVLAAVGTLWSTASWGERLYGVGPTVKLMMLPFLFHHFERSERGESIFTAFLISCALLAVMSWIVTYYPELTMKQAGHASRGIFVKDYIDQSQELTLCAVALAYPVVDLIRAGRVRIALVLCAVASFFGLTMAFVIVSRTALVTLPIMLAVFGLMHLRWRTNIAILCAMVVLGGVTFVVSPQLEWTVKTFGRDYQLYSQQGISTSIGERLEYWKKSLRFFAKAPLIGHGTGSTRGLFTQVASGPADFASAQIINNPHNQTLNVAVQWGIVGVALLYAMWILHLLMFRGDSLAHWIGLLVVVQNIFTSLFNSHIFDFHEGWMYVLGVGVAGGMALRARRVSPSARTGGS